MTDVNANGIRTQEVLLHDEDGNPIPVVTGFNTGEKGLRVFIGPTDPISDIPVVMEFGQHQVHEGESHGADFYTTTVSTISFGLTVPVYASTVRAPHLIFMHRFTKVWANYLYLKAARLQAER